MDIPIEAFIRDPTARRKQRIKEHMKKEAKQLRECVGRCRCSGHDGVDGSVGEFPPLAIASPQRGAAERESPKGGTSAKISPEREASERESPKGGTSAKIDPEFWGEISICYGEDGPLDCYYQYDEPSQDAAWDQVKAKDARHVGNPQTIGVLIKSNPGCAARIEQGGETRVSRHPHARSN